jgi:hypothetical protein
LIFRLYQLPLAPVLYALGLCLFFGAVWLTISWIGFYRKHRLLTAMEGSVAHSLEHLPPHADGLEADYQTLLKALFAARAQLAASSQRDYQDLMEYYTLWVHQIKTPIAAMQLLLQEKDTPEYLELRGELFRVQQYVEMALCYLRLDSRSSDFLFGTCSLDQILRGAIHTYAGQFIRQKVRLQYAPTDMQVRSDAKWLQLVVEQLLSNALKYAPGGTVTIRAGEGTLEIQDDGIGIAPEDLPRIFERGFTGLNGRGPQRSTGLGLYLCRRILTRLGHTISIASVPGQGTTVTLTFSEKTLEFD